MKLNVYNRVHYTKDKKTSTEYKKHQRQLSKCNITGNGGGAGGGRVLMEKVYRSCK